MNMVSEHIAMDMGHEIPWPLLAAGAAFSPSSGGMSWYGGSQEQGRLL
jgi:hypothetical protein